MFSKFYEIMFFRKLNKFLNKVDDIKNLKINISTSGGLRNKYYINIILSNNDNFDFYIINNVFNNIKKNKNVITFIFFEKFINNFIKNHYKYEKQNFFNKISFIFYIFYNVKLYQFKNGLLPNNKSIKTLNFGLVHFNNQEIKFDNFRKYLNISFFMNIDIKLYQYGLKLYNYNIKYRRKNPYTYFKYNKPFLNKIVENNIYQYLFINQYNNKNINKLIKRIFKQSKFYYFFELIPKINLEINKLSEINKDKIYLIEGFTSIFIKSRMEKYDMQYSFKVLNNSKNNIYNIKKLIRYDYYDSFQKEIILKTLLLNLMINIHLENINFNKKEQILKYLLIKSILQEEMDIFFNANFHLEEEKIYILEVKKELNKWEEILFNYDKNSQIIFMEILAKNKKETNSLYKEEKKLRIENNIFDI